MKDMDKKSDNFSTLKYYSNKSFVSKGAFHNH